MAQDGNDFLGDYHWELVELTDSSVFETSGMGQQGKLRMVVADIINPYYSNGVFMINEENTD